MAWSSLKHCNIKGTNNAAKAPNGNMTLLIDNVGDNTPSESAAYNQDDGRWHPKVSAYRLSVITTTIAFGTAKAISFQTGNTFISTTLEWAAGTVIATIFFSVSSYDSIDRGQSNLPNCLAWFFEVESLNCVWSTFEFLFTFKRPRYSSKECVHDLHAYASHPLFTYYQLLVCTTVSTFGLSKAMLAYFTNQSVVMNWMDWTFAVPTTTIFYILGLYEYNNNARIWPSFYLYDRKRALSLGLMSSIGITISLACILGISVFGFYYVWGSPDILEKPSRHDSKDSKEFVIPHLRRRLNSLKISDVALRTTFKYTVHIVVIS
ncbi:hypothetical protein JR316_0002462 [Psilocybe cubensis]|uniref:Uncharacterized protein n=2 Tax=Psilocybe cubensis TaxID=181762 RepID=A0A8H7Y802_PSICU|nr:hypothetical protein JR316_0002462 [Psilocybe cubensis]KAH9485552.1 hypothetical protein JR316_0002462 [Psilocybe cubensis]